MNCARGSFLPAHIDEAFASLTPRYSHAAELLFPQAYVGAVSVNVQRHVVSPGSDEYVDAAWQLKERIREEEGVLRQRRNFFESAYERSTVYLFADRTNKRLVGFAAVRRDGYILFLAVDREYRGQGFGERLVANVAEEHGTVTCHARTTNREALDFYRSLGFTVKRRIDNYYEDGGDAFYLQLGDDAGIRDRLANLLSR
jgi:ribosomal-protein-alanine N-acetyltransferase